MNTQELKKYLDSLPIKIREALNSRQINDLVIKTAQDSGVRQETDIISVRKLVAQNIAGLISADQMNVKLRDEITGIETDKLNGLIEKLDASIIQPIKGAPDHAGNKIIGQNTNNPDKPQFSQANKIRSVNLEDIKPINPSEQGGRTIKSETPVPQNPPRATPVIIQQQTSAPKINTVTDVSLRSIRGGLNSTENLIENGKSQEGPKIKAEVELGQTQSSDKSDLISKLPELDRSNLAQFTPNRKNVPAAPIPMPPPPIPKH